jgi:hypothetical protein
MPALMDKAPVLDVPEMTIDFSAMTWTCVAHGTVMPLDSRADCPECAKAPPDKT